MVSSSSTKWAMKSAMNGLTFVVFFFLDFLDTVLCILFRFLDALFEGKHSHCYCSNRGGIVVDGNESQASETLYGRRNIFREMGLLRLGRKLGDFKKKGGGGGGGGGRVVMNRWSDCGCESCLSWMNDADQKLHFVLKETPQAAVEDYQGNFTENVIFMHGFLSSSSFWAETVFPQLSKSSEHHYKLFSIDLLGFGRSPKPRDCFYTLRDHLDMIEKSVIRPFQLNSFHVVAHSMGCIVATALATKYPESVKSVTLVAPPYYPYSEADASKVALERFAKKKLWPPMAFGSSVMSWYEHVGRFVCFLVCRNHRTWEWILKLLTRKRELHYMAVDFTKHTHHSAWHNMHNVICGGAKLMDEYLEVLHKYGVKISIFHGDRDSTVPIECSNIIKMKFPNAKVNIVPNAGHTTVIVGREMDFIKSLEHIWVPR